VSGFGVYSSSLLSLRLQEQRKFYVIATKNHILFDSLTKNTLQRLGQGSPVAPERLVSVRVLMIRKKSLRVWGVPKCCALVRSTLVRWTGTSSTYTVGEWGNHGLRRKHATCMMRDDMMGRRGHRYGFPYQVPVPVPRENAVGFDGDLYGRKTKISVRVHIVLLVIRNKSTYGRISSLNFLFKIIIIHC
jgi:hypothetical protein